jgi:hypothetical protein
VGSLEVEEYTKKTCAIEDFELTFESGIGRAHVAFWPGGSIRFQFSSVECPPVNEDFLASLEAR